MTWPQRAKRDAGSSVLGRASTSCSIVERYSRSLFLKSSTQTLEKAKGSSFAPRHWLNPRDLTSVTLCHFAETEEHEPQVVLLYCRPGPILDSASQIAAA